MESYRNYQGVLLLSIAGLALLLDNSVADARTVICESINRQTQYCRTDTRGGVRLAKQFSKSSCFEGETWGYDHWGIWVTGGCRAKFETEDYYADPYRNRDYDNQYRSHEGRRHRQSPRTIKCESWRNGESYCRVPLGNARVEIERQLSETECRLGENWGWDRGGIWVTRGCRAVFSIY